MHLDFGSLLKSRKINRWIILPVLLLGVAFFLSRLSLDSMDLFFLDLRQVLINGNPPPNRFDIYDISSLKEAKSTGTQLSEDQIFKVLDALGRAGYRKIILGISPKEIEFVNSKRFIENLNHYQNVYLYEDYLRNRESSFGSTADFQNYPRHLEFTFTRDTRFDGVTRRLLLYYDLKKSRYNPDFDLIFRELKLSSKTPDFFEDNFKYLDSIQVYLKIWSSSSLNNIEWKNRNFNQKVQADLGSRIAIIGSSGTYGLMASPSMVYRTNIFSDSSI